MNPFADLVPTQKKTSASMSSNNPFVDLTPGYKAPEVPVSSATPQEEPKGSKVGNLFKSIVTAPATMIARPLQLGAELIMPGDNSEAIDKFSKEKLGGVVAPLPKTFSDVKKDVGRGVQTVALGTGAPIAGGAAFGVGSSLEQGNDLFSVDTLINTSLGAAGGKAIDWIGKPILNAAGKVIGTITPQILKDVASKGGNAIKKFAEENQLLGGVVKPISEKIATGFQAIDDKAGSLFKGGGSKIKDVISEQYPSLSKENRQNHYLEVNRKNILQPTTEISPSYAKATRISKDAERRGIDLGEVIDDTKTFDHQIKENGRYSTIDHADELENSTKQFGSVVRQALREAEPGVQRVAVSDIKNAMIKKVDAIPPSQITPDERAMMRKQIEKRYGEGSQASREYKNGYGLTDLFDNRIISQTRGKYKEGGIMSDALNAERSRYEGQVFNEIMDSIVPEEVGLSKVRREMEKRFVLSDYLRALNNKKAPTTVVGKASSLFGRAVGGIAGSKVAGGYGALLGSRFGDVFFDFLENTPNPIRTKILESIKKETPAAYRELIEYIEKAGKDRLLRPTLPAPTTIFSGPTQGGQPYTPNRLFGTTPVVETKKVPQ